MPAYAELQVTSNYSFLRGASHIEELFAQASLLGLTALAASALFLRLKPDAGAEVSGHRA